MQLYGALILFLTLSTACGLRCYTCETINPKSCTEIQTCPADFKICFSLTLDRIITKGCSTSDSCESPMTCCDRDLCNGATPNGPSVILLLVSSAIITLRL
ncbi:lymphocyte antigen 6G-like [Scomber japonicus]|uniref:lymphocyte antigen 6G-like n=1 Tax=Scomber japonicus TaxID=13676 RepID=UPI002305F1C9|nr:lymphocyte antigen 6G-like [Scomber japonicus]